MQSMFAKVKDYADDQDSFVCVLVDEVESLVSARKAALNGTEPSDCTSASTPLSVLTTELAAQPFVPSMLF